MPTLTQIEYIVAVQKYGHFGKAATNCHVSQPSLSIQIQKVEEEIGFLIFDRLKKPILPTEKGQRFIEQAKILLREHQKLIDIAKQDENEISGDFHLGIIPTLTPYLLPLFLDEFAHKHTKVKLKIDELKTSSIIEELNDDRLDAGLLALPINVSGLRERILFYEPFYLYVSKDHELSKRKRIKEEELDGCEMWLLQDGHCLRNQVSKVCSIKKDKGVYNNILFSGGNLETLCNIIKRNRGYTLIPQLFMQSLSETERQTHVKELEHPAPGREIGLVYRRDQWKLEIIKSLENIIRSSLPNDVKQTYDKRKISVLDIK